MSNHRFPLKPELWFSPTELFLLWVIVLAIFLKEILAPSFNLNGWYQAVLILLFIIASIAFFREIIQYVIAEYIFKVRLNISDMGYDPLQKIFTISAILSATHNRTKNEKITFLYLDHASEGVSYIKICPETVNWKNDNEFECSVFWNNFEDADIRFFYLVIHGKYKKLPCKTYFKIKNQP